MNCFGMAGCFYCLLFNRKHTFLLLFIKRMLNNMFFGCFFIYSLFVTDINKLRKY